MKTMFSFIRCLQCGHEIAADLCASRCDACGGLWLDARYDLDNLPTNWPEIVAQRPANLWRYRELLPFPEEFEFVTMGEGWTPLTRAPGLEWETGHGGTGGEIWIKDERQSPTGSLKDRQAAFTTSTLKAQGIKEMVLASTGNAAAAYAAYCARAGIKLWVFLPSSVPAEKMRELALYGAEVVKITGTYDQAKEIAADFAARRGIYKDHGAKAIPGKESMKTIALEIAEQLPPLNPPRSRGGGREASRERGRERDASREQGREREASRERGREREAPRERGGEREASRERGREQEASRERGREREASRERGKDPQTSPLRSGGERGGVWNAPDWYIQAVSGGIGPLGVLKGFTELYAAGLIDRVPKLGIVQVEGCAPMVQAWEHGLAQAAPVQPDTLVTVLSTGKPGMAYEILKQACDQYGGAMVSVSDGEAFRAMRRVARTEGFSMEPAASVAFAGLDKLLAESTIQPGERVVVNCSGHTFSAEKHALEDRHVFHLKADIPTTSQLSPEGLAMTLEQLDEQITSIVVIDDNPNDSRLIRRLLQSYKKYRIFEANNGLDGIDLVRQRRPDLVMLDLSMPGTDGFAVMEEIKADERTREIPVVIVSAKTLTSDEWGFLHRYTDSIWQKGNFNARELVGHVAEMLGDAGLPNEAAQQVSTTTSTPTQLEHPLEAFGQDQRPNILIVDDHITDARLLRRLFEANHHFRVTEAHSAAEALNAIEDETPDLIILDLTLPDINGEELLDTLRQHEGTREVPVVIVSAKDISPNLRARLVAQVDSVWSKAVLDRSNLLAHVETILPE
jgi:threonine synthase/DNA-binding response OmpR family regulator